MCGSVVCGNPCLSLWSVPPQMLTGKPAAQKASSDLLDASVVSDTSRYIEEQQATQQVCVVGQKLWAREACGRQDSLPTAIPCLQSVADHGPTRSTAGNGVWEHPGFETHVWPHWGGAG